MVPHDSPLDLPEALRPLPIRFRQARDGSMLEVDDRIQQISSEPFDAWMASPECFWNHLEEGSREELKASLLDWTHGTEPVTRLLHIRHPGSGMNGVWLESRRWLADAMAFEGHWIDRSLAWRLHQRLEAMQAGDLLHDLLPGYVHELNNALTGIVSLTELALLEMPPGHAMEPHLRDLTGRGRAMKQLIRSLAGIHESLDPARPGSMEWLDLNAAVRQAVETVEPALPRSLQVDVELTEAPVPVMGEAAALQRGLIHLLLNAIRHASGGGTLRIVTRANELPAQPQRDVPHASLSVINRGAGLDPGLHEDVFDLDFSTRPGRAGIGSGLHFLHRTLTAMGGRVAFTVNKEGDVQVDGYLPLAQDEDPPPLATPHRFKPTPRLVDVTGRGVDDLVARLPSMAVPRPHSALDLERGVACGSLPARGWIVWAGSLEAAAMRRLQRLTRFRPRLGLFLVTSAAPEAQLKVALSWVERASTLEALDLTEAWARWLDENESLTGDMQG